MNYLVNWSVSLYRNGLPHSASVVMGSWNQQGMW